MGEHAVVLGASMAGLLAARVLTDFYDRVTLVERDELPGGVEHRRGVPQGRHAHALLASGSSALDELLPGILAELVDDGAVVACTDEPTDFWQELGGHCLRQESVPFKQSLRMYLATRPFIEAHVRRRVSALSTVTVLDGHDVVDLVAAVGRIAGVRVAPHAGGPEQLLDADLVVDVMGRGSRTPAFLDKLGYGRPEVQGTEIRVTYTTQLVRVRPPAPPAKLFLIGAKPETCSGAAFFTCENDRWLLTTVGLGGCEPPTEWDAMVAFTDGWAPEPLVSALRRAEPIGEPTRYRYPASQWRRYDLMRRFPPGLLVMGDALCSFNPVYGQGMSVAALEALALRDCLRSGDAALSRRFFAAAAKPVGVAWELARGSDLTIPGVQAPRTLGTRVSGWYTDRLVATCGSDPTVHEAFARVTNLLDPPSRLMSPSILLRVLGSRRKAERAVHTADTRRAAVGQE
ncbi:FAD-dependent oxidoreductase [Mycolicibacterium mengxianglii]|uniref:FAD-dependent oxidoreductase n=1 Tax=Mycolicibacterium mengxianglii TaxID=2736649 RepID=UPI0018EF333E|nr:2-polyprenyl-6-methoxyphenol hydroxylase-like oxidoreductase [Mycolicibacterium mengxianglii]